MGLSCIAVTDGCWGQGGWYRRRVRCSRLPRRSRCRERGHPDCFLLSESGRRPGVFQTTISLATRAQTPAAAPARRRCTSFPKSDETHRRIYQAPAGERLLRPRPSRRVHTSPRQLQPRRAVPAAGAWLARDGALRERDTQTHGLGGTALRRGERLTRAAAVPAAAPRQRERRVPAGRNGAEPEALAPSDRLGAPRRARRGRVSRPATPMRRAGPQTAGRRHHRSPPGVRHSPFSRR